MKSFTHVHFKTLTIIYLFDVCVLKFMCVYPVQDLREVTEKRTLSPLDLELQMVVNRHVGSET